MEQTKLKALELNAAKARLYGVQMVHDAASGHPGGSMSCMDVLTYLYFAEMRVQEGVISSTSDIPPMPRAQE